MTHLRSGRSKERAPAAAEGTARAPAFDRGYGRNAARAGAAALRIPQRRRALASGGRRRAAQSTAGGAYTEEELRLAVRYIRTFCTDQRWPRGELNLPRPLVTAKAFPEDEVVATTSANADSVVTKFIYEKRFGPLNQIEIIVPLSSVERTGSGRATGVGDIALEYKRVLGHSLARGNIVSATAEFVLPTGSESKGLGGGIAVFEPFVTFGQMLPRDGFVQAQVGFAIPMNSGHDREVFWRAAVGKTFEQGRFGRIWSPMLEVLAARPLVSGAPIEWDLLPGAQVTLNTRQHVRLAGGVRLPVTDADVRRKSLIVYLLWD